MNEAPPPPPPPPHPRRNSWSGLTQPRAEAEQVLRVLWTTQDAAERRAANEWLTGLQGSAEAWTVAIALVASGSEPDFKQFGATLLCNKLRGGGGGGLPSDQAAGLRSELLQQLRVVPSGRLQASLCRAAAGLVDAGAPSADGVLGRLLADPDFRALRMDAMLELLTAVPDEGAFISVAEVQEIQELLLELLGHALGGAAFPARLPAAAAPTPGAADYCQAALRCASCWAAQACSEGVSLSMVAEERCFEGLLACLGGVHGPEPQLLAAELCVAALANESCAALETAAEGISMTDLPPAAQLQLLAALATALAPLQASAAAAADDAGGDGDEDGEDGQRAARCAMIRLGATLLAKGSAVLAPGADAPPAALSLLSTLVACCGHPAQAYAESALGENDEWVAALLRVCGGWGAVLAAQLHASLTQALFRRAAHPGEAAVSGWGERELRDHDEFRHAFLAAPLAEVTRHAPTLIVDGTLGLLAQRATPQPQPGGGVGAPPWQQLEAALFAAQAAAEPYLIHVVAIPARYQADGPPSAARAHLSEAVPALLGALLAPAAVAEPSALGGQLLHTARCALLRAWAGWLHEDGAALEAAMSVLLHTLQAPHPLAAEAAATALAQLSYHCQVEIASSTSLLDAMLAALHEPMPALSVERRTLVLESCARCVARSPPPHRLEPLFAPLCAQLEAQLGACEAGRADAAPGLAAALELVAAALKPLRPLGGPTVLQALHLLWPLWSRAAAVAASAALASDELHAAVGGVGRAALQAAGDSFAPLLPPTVGALVASFRAAPSAAGCELACSFVRQFCTSTEAYASFASLLAELSAAVLPALRQPDSGAPEELLTSYLELCELYAKLGVPALVASGALPGILELAAELLAACRQRQPMAALLNVLEGAARSCRYAHAYAAEAAQVQPALQAALQAHLSGGAGEALLRAAVLGLADSLPPAAVPRVADFLAPLLRSPGWAASVPAWAQAAIAEVPAVDGVPDEGTRRALLHTLVTLPDACPPGGLDLGVADALRDALVEFARACRRMTSAADFDTEAYAWS